MTTIKSICAYCGSSPGNQSGFAESAFELGRRMAERGIRLVYGGGTSGIMGAVARGVREGHGHVTGIIPQFLLDHEAEHDPHSVCDEVIVTKTMHERKQLMFELSDAFVTLPGGIGTLEEIVEMMTWRQLDRHTKPLCFLNTGNFWQPMFEMVNHMRSEGFLHSDQKLQLLIEESPDLLLQLIEKNINFR